MKTSASGRFVVRLPPKTHDRLRREASQRGMSLNAICRQALESHIAKSRGGRSVGDAESSFANEIQAMFADSLLGIVLFGSAARGESREGSDIDLLVVLGPERSLSRSLYSLWDERFGVVKESPHFVHVPANPGDAGSIWLEAAVDGIVLFDRDGAVSRFLGSIRRLIASGDRKRRWAYGHPYWVKGERGNENVQ